MTLKFSAEGNNVTSEANVIFGITSLGAYDHVTLF